MRTSLLEPGRNCWRVEKAGRAALVVDACDYYRLALEAMLEAREQILLIGWDFDTRIALTAERHPSGAPRHLGPLLSWLARRRKSLDIRILAWDEGLLHVPGRGTTALRLLRWKAHPRISVKWDSRHPLEGSHHQKILVVDDRIGFCGGIDITASRWDTRRHRDEEPGRRRPFTRRRYGPWHDATMAVDGDAARALGELARERWRLATGKSVPGPQAESEPWPEALEPHFRDPTVAIARTRGEDGDISEIREIEALFADMIAAARRFVYVETQYFASRVVAEAVARRLEEADGPEFVVVNPRTAWGWLEEQVMGAARAELVEALRKKDRHGRFRIYSPVTEGGDDIYVHAKIMIVDDLWLRVGSANMNNRSMGLDSECDLVVDARGDRAAAVRIAELRCDLLAEHLGCSSGEVERATAEKKSLIAAVESLCGKGRSLRPLEPEPPDGVRRKVAEGQWLDPEHPDPFEPRARPGLLARLPRWRGRGRS